jgi:hypothetical protein
MPGAGLVVIEPKLVLGGLPAMTLDQIGQFEITPVMQARSLGSQPTGASNLTVPRLWRLPKPSRPLDAACSRSERHGWRRRRARSPCRRGADRARYHQRHRPVSAATQPNGARAAIARSIIAAASRGFVAKLTSLHPPRKQGYGPQLRPRDSSRQTSHRCV